MTRKERVEALLSKVYADNPLTSVDDLRDFAMEAEEDDDNPVRPTYREVKDFLGGQERSQVFKDLPPKEEWKATYASPSKLA